MTAWDEYEYQAPLNCVQVFLPTNQMHPCIPATILYLGFEIESDQLTWSYVARTAMLTHSRGVT